MEGTAGSQEVFVERRKGGRRVNDIQVVVSNGVRLTLSALGWELSTSTLYAPNASGRISAVQQTIESHLEVHLPLVIGSLLADLGHKYLQTEHAKKVLSHEKWMGKVPLGFNHRAGRLYPVPAIRRAIAVQPGWQPRPQI